MAVRYLIGCLLLTTMFVIVGVHPVMGEEECTSALSEAARIPSLLKKKAALERLVEECPDQPEVFFQYAYCLERLRRYEEARKYYEKAIRLDPENPRYLFGLGDVYKNLGEDAKALAAYRKGLEQEPGNRRVMGLVEELEARGVKAESSRTEQVLADITFNDPSAIVKGLMKASMASLSEASRFDSGVVKAFHQGVSSRSKMDEGFFSSGR